MRKEEKVANQRLTTREKLRVRRFGRRLNIAVKRAMPLKYDAEGFDTVQFIVEAESARYSHLLE